MKRTIVGISDCAASSDRDDTLVTYALGSCIALALFDPVVSVGGLLHVLLPDATLDLKKAERNPSMFADTGVPELVSRCVGLGAAKKRFFVWMAGGSAVMDESGIFNIGKRNELAMRKALWKAGLILSAEDVGGGSARTVRLKVGDGSFWVSADGGAERELKVKGRISAAGRA